MESMSVEPPVAEERAVWDMSPWFSSVESPEFVACRASWRSGVAALLEELEGLGRLEEGTVEGWAAALCRREEVQRGASHLWSYLHCSASADTGDEAIRRAHAAMSDDDASVERIRALVVDGLSGAAEGAFGALLDHPSLKGGQYTLGRLREQGRQRLPREMELLVADLAVSGHAAWGRLHDQIDGALSFELSTPEEPARRVPMSFKRSLTQDPDPRVRKAALEGSNAAWAQHAEALAASLNAIAGWRLTLNRWRGVEHFLTPALFQSAISAEVLDAMLGAVASRRPTLWGYLKHKARLIDRPRLGFQDLSCPLPQESPRRLGWSEARAQVIGAFERFEPELGDFARMAFERRWIDAEARAGKRSGGFCIRSLELGQTRIFMTFNHTLGDVQTLAHELGHAFHGWVMRDLRPLTQSYPMTLAETASMFGEAILADGVLADPQILAGDKAAVLDTRLSRAVGSLLDIPMRYQFEKSFYEERASGEVSASRLQALMIQAQRDCFGDCLDEGELDPWFWASKAHFFKTGANFYNFPYTFGYLFSQGVYARARREGPGFFEAYKALLRRTGSADPEVLAREALGVELARPDFWLESLDLVDDDLRRFEEAVACR